MSRGDDPPDGGEGRPFHPGIPPVEGYDFDALLNPAGFEGEFCDFLPLDSGRLGILVAAVSGRGPQCAIVGATTRKLFHAEAPHAGSCVDALERMNRLLVQEIPRGMFVMATYAVLSPREGFLAMANSGHNPMVVWQNASKTCQTVNANGMALGIDPGPLFLRTIQERKIQLLSGDRFVLHSDAMIETKDQSGETFGANRAYLLVRQLGDRPSREFTSLIDKVLEEHRGGTPVTEDVVIVTGRRMA